VPAWYVVAAGAREALPGTVTPPPLNPKTSGVGFGEGDAEREHPVLNLVSWNVELSGLTLRYPHPTVCACALRAQWQLYTEPFNTMLRH
jgi:hypothetical protein